MKRKTIIGSGIVLIGMLVSGLAASVAWFLAGDNTFKTDVNGSVVEEYFHCGSGTEADPFVITRPMHYYHMVEFFQRKTELPVSDEHNVTFGTDYLYFQIGYDLDENPANGLEVYDYDNDGTYNDNTSKVLNMAYFSGDNALMPIGTSECPFFGSFDGGATNYANAIKVQNLNIKSHEDVIIEGGSSLTTRYTSDVGMFGYVADNDGDSNTTSIKNIYIDGLDIDLTGAVAGKDAADAEGVSHTSEHDDKIYVGYIVGHMHTYTRYDRTGPTNSSPIHDVYVNNATIEGGAGATCNFGYVGHADTINGVSGDDIDLTEIINDLAVSSGGGGGQGGTEWGGSINMMALNERLYDLLNTNLETRNITTNVNYQTGHAVQTRTGSYYRHRYYADEYNQVTVYNSNGTYYNNNPEQTKVVYAMEGLTEVRSSNGETQGTTRSLFKVPQTVLPLLVNNDYSTDTANNTGYIVGGDSGNSSDTYTSRSVVRSSSYEISRIENSYDTGTANMTVYTNAGVEFNTGFSIISDTNNFKKYTKAKTTLSGILEGESYVQGLHFMGGSVTENNPVIKPSAWIYGTRYIDFELPTGCIDFNLKEKGYINFFAGSYGAAVDTTIECDSFFSLNIIKRTGVDLTKTKEISKIYKNTNTNTNTNHPFVYLCTDNSYSTGSTEVDYTVGELVFDMQFLWEDPPYHHSLYYFEIPVNAGEFAMGTHSGRTKGTYLLYLDIAASGGEEQHNYNTDNMISNDTIFTQMEYTSSGYVINSCFNIAYVVPAGATKETFAITVSRSGTVFSVEVVNTTTNIFRLHVLLVDNNNDPDDEYPYSYTLKYNTGAVSSAYSTSGSYQGAASGTVLERLLT